MPQAKKTTKAPAKKAAPKTTEVPKSQATQSKPAYVEFVSASRDEPNPIIICKIRPSRTPSGKLLFRVPTDMAEAFARHYHVVSGRILKV